MKPYLIAPCLLAALPASHAQSLDWRPGPYQSSGGGNGVTILSKADDRGDWISANPAGNAIDLSDPNATGTYYYGFDWTITNNAGETGGGGFFGGLWFFQSGAERGGAGNGWTSVAHELAGPGWNQGTTPASPYAVGTKVRLVLKVVFNAGANDTLTLWVNPVASAGEGGQTVPVATSSRNFSFDALNLRTGNGTGASTLENLMISSDFASAAAWDADNDGLPDGWERRFGLSAADDGSTDINNGPAGDPDNDLLTNAQEFANSTNPSEATDSDGDGLLDGRELAGSDNPWTAGVLGAAPGDPTSAALADSDSDGISDGEEVVSGTDGFVTNPNDSDTDDDGFKDGVETALASDPRNAASQPVVPNREIIGIEHFDYSNGTVGGLNGGEFFDFDNSVEGDPVFGHTGQGSNWNVIAGAPQIIGGRLVTANGAGAKREFNGPTEGNGLGSAEREGRHVGGTSDVLYFRYLLKRDRGAEWSGASLYDYGQEVCFLGVPSDVNPVSGRREFGIQQSNAAVVNGANRNWTGIAPEPNRDYLVVVKASFATGTVSLWVDPDLGQPEGAPDTQIQMAAVSQLNATGLRLASAGAGSSRFDELVVGSSWSGLSTPAASTNGSLRDTWAASFGISDPGDDGDGDLLTALQEQTAGTDPYVPDSDGDGLSDAVETSGSQNPWTGGILGATPGEATDPNKADSDDDGIQDAEEIVAGADTYLTDPNRFDTDADGSSDGAEVTFGSNPTDPASLFGGNRGLVGADDFSDKTDGPAAGATGGQGFDFDNTLANDGFIGHTGTASDYDDVGGVSSFVGGKLRTQESSVKREFNGPGEGAVVNGDEWSGRFNSDPASSDSQVVYFRADLTRGADSTWSGISAYDFGTERAFVGVAAAPSPVSGELEFAIGAPAATPVYTGIRAVAGRTYTMVCKIDYANDLLSLWIDPDLTGSEPAPVATTPFTLTNWTTAVRLGSGGASPTDWDHLVVARKWSELGIFPGQQPPSDDFDSWIAGYPGVGAVTGFDQDADGDGLSNGVESYLGTDPSQGNAGLTALSAAAGVFTFTHPESNEIPADVSSAYEWSTDLATWSASGATQGGVTVSVGESARIDNAAPANDLVTATATVTGGSATRVFVRLRATRN
jgi:hypothetical protein